MDRYEQLIELRKNWTPPAELAGSLPREVRLSAAGIALAVVATLMSAGAVAAFVGLEAIASRESTQRLLLEQQGVNTSAVITRLWRARDKERQPMVAYRFEYDGRAYEGQAKVSLRIWNTLAEGSPLPVRLVPSNPGLNHPSDWPGSQMPAWLPPVVAVFLAAVAALLVFLLRCQRHLLSDGRPAPAIVTRYSLADHGRKRVHYEFAQSSGARGQGKSGPMRKLPPIGSTLCVIYDPENPRRSAPYPMDLVKPAGAGGRGLR